MKKTIVNIISSKMFLCGILILTTVFITIFAFKLSNEEKYSITYESNGGTFVTEIIINKDGTLEKPTDPTKEGYKFAGWYHNGQLYDFSQPVVSDIKLEAKWEEIKDEPTNNIPNVDVSDKTDKETNTQNNKKEEANKKISVIFKNDDGTILSNKTYKFGEKIEIPENPSKEADAQYTYTFAGWNKNVTDIAIRNVTYTAKYTKTINKYLIMWNVDGKISLETYEYGLIPTYKNEINNKPIDNIYNYVFNGWDKEIEKVTQNVTYTAQFKEEYIDYTVEFKNDDGTTVSSKTYHYGDEIEAPENPTKAADAQYTYTFAGWDKEVANTVTSDVTYIATYTKTLNSYTIIFNDEDGTQLSSKVYNYGDIVEVPENPSKDADTQYTYVFSGWDKEVTTVTGDTTYTAIYTQIINKYLVIWSVDGKTSVETYEYNAIPTYKGEINKPSTNVYNYIFNGWDKEIENVTKNITYTAQFKEEYRNYTVEFKNDDGTDVSSKTYHYGDTVEIPENPTKPADAQYTYTFAGWDREVANTVTSDVTYIATYTKTLNSYTIIFNDEDGTQLSSKVYNYGDIVEVPENLSKEGDAQYTYTFAGWDKEVTTVTGDTTYTAIYTQTLNKYKVIWNVDGTVTEEMYDYGTVPTYKGETNKPSTNVYNYIFNGWDKEIEEVTQNVTYTAQFKEEYRNYTIEFKNDDGTDISSKTYHYGETVEIPVNPTKAADAQYTYTFAGWDREVANTVTSDVTYIATYTKTLNSYTIIFKNADGTQLSSKIYNYGDTVEIPTNPTKPADSRYSYTFTGWDKEVTTVTEDTTYTATYTKTINMYTVTFKNYDDTILETQKVEYGTIPSYTGSMPVKPTDTYEYKFMGWDKTFTIVKGDTEYKATFKPMFNIDNELTTKTSTIISSGFTVSKDKNTIKVKFNDATKKIWYYFTDIANTLHTISSNETYASVVVSYTYPGKETSTIDLKKYNLNSTEIEDWLDEKGNRKVAEFLGYVGCGESEVLSAYKTTTGDLIGKKLKITFKLAEGVVSEKGNQNEVYYLEFN